MKVIFMAATVQIVGYYGAAPGTKTALTAQRYCTANQRDPGLAYPCNVPPSGETYRSYWVFTGAEIIGGTYSQLSNWRWGTPGTIKNDWSLGAGMVQVALRDAGDPGCPVANYEPPAGVQGEYGYDIKDPNNGLDYYNSQTVACADADLYKTTNPLVFDTTVITPASNSKITKLVTHQLVLKDDTDFGEKGELSNFVRWQEI